MQALLRCWDLWEQTNREHRRNLALLGAAAKRVRQPRLSMCFAHWQHDWNATTRRAARRTHAIELENERERRLDLEQRLAEVGGGPREECRVMREPLG